MSEIDYAPRLARLKGELKPYAKKSGFKTLDDWMKMLHRLTNDYHETHVSIYHVCCVGIP